jgi:NAD(P)-dependent dehydrogenase (short-subunit alcohol dehydrogenase family)
MTSTANYRSLKDRVVVITGSGQGLGRTYAHHFAEQGAIPVLAEIAGDKALAVEREIKDQGGRALAITTDVTDENSVEAMVQHTLDAYGRIDCLVNNASLLQQIKTDKFWDIPAEVWRHVIDVNVTGAFLCAKAVAPTMKARRYGRIVNVSSPTVNVGRENYLHYVTSKSAMIGMTRAMARELGPWDITVNTFWPGVVLTELARESVSREHFEQMVQAQCLKRPAAMEDHARAVLFLCSDEASFITGQGLQADGGRTFQ